MRKVSVTSRIKPWVMPAAMVFGWIFHEYIGSIAFISPYLIFLMLLITFCKVKPGQIRVTAFIWRLLAVQLIASLVVYFALLPLSPDIATGTFICVFCPTATSAPVVTAMLGGNISRVATFSIISNVCVAILAPLLFAEMAGLDGEHLSVSAAMGEIAWRVVPLIILPLPLAFLLAWKSPRVHKAIAEHQSLSFYIWAVALFIVVGRAVSYVVTMPSEKVPEMLCLMLAAGIVCVLQFIVGRRIGQRSQASDSNLIFDDERVAGAQSLGQKNTVLAIWMAMTFFNPITSVAPAAYVVWQNTINSAQIFRKTRRDTHRTSAQPG